MFVLLWFLVLVWGRVDDRFIELRRSVDCPSLRTCGIRCAARGEFGARRRFVPLAYSGEFERLVGSREEDTKQ